jgi:4-oxalocrotonate tautomerase
MPIIRVEIWKGKSAEVKKFMAKSLTNAMVESIGCQPQAVTVIIDEIPKADWFMGAKDCNEIFPGVE